MPNLLEFEDLILKAEGIADLLGMASECADSFANGLNNYSAGFCLLYNLACENAKELNDLKNKMYEEKIMLGK